VADLLWAGGCYRLLLVVISDSDVHLFTTMRFFTVENSGDNIDSKQKFKKVGWENHF
jgi:hypothetical protein